MRKFDNISTKFNYKAKCMTYIRYCNFKFVLVLAPHSIVRLLSKEICILEIGSFQFWTNINTLNLLSPKYFIITINWEVAFLHLYHILYTSFAVNVRLILKMVKLSTMIMKKLNISTVRKTDMTSFKKIGKTVWTQYF